MAPTKQITFYNASLSPHAHRVHIALEDARADYISYEVNLQNKPDWFNEVSPLGKVPAIAYGPKSPSGKPPAESDKLFESLALLEFLADIYPEAKLLPTDPVLRAKARAFTMLYQTHVDDAFRQTFFFAQPACDTLLAALEQLQAVLPPVGFAAGEWSIAEAAVVPFLERLRLYLDVGLGRYSKEDGGKMRSAFAGARLARLRKYLDDAREHPSFKKTWGSDATQAEMGKTIPILRSG
ncbi:thioredoxin-like protein [Trametes meyenii]|nr:thioredoxin-like protein [Trametes meyenii]